MANELIDAAMATYGSKDWHLEAFTSSTGSIARNKWHWSTAHSVRVRCLLPVARRTQIHGYDLGRAAAGGRAWVCRGCRVSFAGAMPHCINYQTSYNSRKCLQLTQSSAASCVRQGTTNWISSRWWSSRTRSLFVMLWRLRQALHISLSHAQALGPWRKHSKPWWIGFLRAITCNGAQSPNGRNQPRTLHLLLHGPLKRICSRKG